MPVKILTFSPTKTVRRISSDRNGCGNNSGREWKRSSTSIGFSVIIQHPLSAIMAESTATLAFGAVVLLFVLGNRHAAALHWHGRPSLAFPDVVFDLVVRLLAVIWASSALCGRLSWSNWFSHRQGRYTG
jgi:hypothetical protein